MKAFRRTQLSLPRNYWPSRPRLTLWSKKVSKTTSNSKRPEMYLSRISWTHAHSHPTTWPHTVIMSWRRDLRGSMTRRQMVDLMLLSDCSAVYMGVMYSLRRTLSILRIVCWTKLSFQRMLSYWCFQNLRLNVVTILWTSLHPCLMISTCQRILLTNSKRHSKLTKLHKWE